MNTYSLDYIDDLYVRYIQDPSSVSEVWRRYFEEFSLAAQSENAYAENATAAVATTPVSSGAASTDQQPDALWLARMQERVDQLVREYRVRGHLMAKIDPLGLSRKGPPELDPQSHGLTEEDLRRPFTSPTLEYAKGRTLADIIEKLRNTYCRSIGVQFMHIDNRNIRDWLQRRMESTENRLTLSRDVQLRIYTKLADAAIFEEFVRKKYTGARRFLWKVPRVSFRCSIEHLRKLDNTVSAALCSRWHTEVGSTCSRTSWANASKYLLVL